MECLACLPCMCARACVPERALNRAFLSRHPSGSPAPHAAPPRCCRAPRNYPLPGGCLCEAVLHCLKWQAGVAPLAVAQCSLPLTPFLCSPPPCCRRGAVRLHLPAGLAGGPRGCAEQQGPDAAGAGSHEGDPRANAMGTSCSCINGCDSTTPTLAQRLRAAAGRDSTTRQHAARVGMLWLHRRAPPTSRRSPCLWSWAPTWTPRWRSARSRRPCTLLLARGDWTLWSACSSVRRHAWEGGAARCKPGNSLFASCACFAASFNMGAGLLLLAPPQEAAVVQKVNGPACFTRCALRPATLPCFETHPSGHKPALPCPCRSA